MSVQQLDRNGQPDMVNTVEQQITQRTWGRIHRCQVELNEGRLIVHGCTSTYYAKQLALEAALEVLGLTDATSVELDIRVGNDSHRSAREEGSFWFRTPSDFD